MTWLVEQSDPRVVAGRLRGVEGIRRNTIERNKARDRNYDEVLLPAIKKIRGDRIEYRAALITYLNEKGLTNFRGKEWNIDRLRNALIRQRRREFEEFENGEGVRIRT